VAAYQRTLVTDAKQVPFDRYAMGRQEGLNDAQQRGMALYQRQGRLHPVPQRALASDQKFYRLGVPEHPGFQDDPLCQITHRWEHCTRRAYRKGKYRNAATDFGLYYITKNPKDIGKFRTPSLRELKYTGPYMHNGMFWRR
jgi:cytochrome c peroxidase